MLIIDHTGKKPQILQISTTPEQTLEFKTDLTERIIVGKFGNFENPNDPVAIVREGFNETCENHDVKQKYSIKMVNTFELASLLKHKGNKGRYIFIEKIVFCLSNSKCFMLKHFYDATSPQLFKLTNKHKSWQMPLEEAQFDPDELWQTKV